jgi:ABC-type sugar transport system substrate-binding protein
MALTSSRETQDLNECYQHGVNAYVVKPVDFAEFAKAIKRLGAFWTVVNEPPPDSGEEETELPKGYVPCLGTDEVKNEIPPIHPAR